MAFRISPNVHVERDPQGIVRQLRHLQEPYLPAAQRAALTPQGLAEAYVRDVAGIYGLDPSALTALSQQPSADLTDDGAQLRYAAEKSVMESSVLSYAQTYYGLPIWEAGLTVNLHDRPLRVTSSYSTLHYNVEVAKPNPEVIKRMMSAPHAGFDAGALAPAGAAAGPTGEPAAGPPTEGRQQPQIQSTRMIIYRYDPAQRFDPESQGKDQAGALQSGPPTIALPPVPESIQAGKHYVVREILFSYAALPFGELNWRAFQEPETGAILYLRAFYAACTGSVFMADPPTTTGDASISASSPAATLDGLRTPVTLEGLTPGMPQALTGEFVQVTDTDPPNVAPPTSGAPCNFIFSATTNDFAAVNAYYHLDSLYRMVRDMGWNPITTYFGGTSFPVPADHAGESGVNAHAIGLPGGTGLQKYTFGLCQAGAPVGIAAERRVVMHEFGHQLLYDHVHSPNFGFAHSCGDSIGAILMDPGSSAPDRFLTFPFVPAAPRRHDRPVAGGWAWGGVNDVGSYSSEQILSTTLFRIYRSTGGDSSRLDVQRFAARYLIYVILRGIASLGPAPITPTNTPDVFATALMNADQGTINFEGHPGGAFHKVIRWGFEKQGLYQPAGAPTPVTTEGAPPDVDVYIDDGRHGEYQYQEVFWGNQSIINRLAPDGTFTHQTPIVGVSNYVYVKVKNRGTQQATGVVVKGFHCRPSTGLVWPDDWQAMTTAELSVPGGIAPGSEVIVGPFEWTPTEIGHECLLMYANADGDRANTETVNGPIPHWRLVPFDNNIGQRNVAPVAGGGGGAALARSFEQRHYWVSNPYDRTVKVEIELAMPEFLSRRGWDVQFLNPGGAAFTLGPRASRQIVLRLKQGEDFKLADVTTDAVIQLKTLADGKVVGGMHYLIDTKLKAPAQELPSSGGDQGPRNDAARQLLASICGEIAGDVQKVKIKRVVVEIDLKDDGC